MMCYNLPSKNYVKTYARAFKLEINYTSDEVVEYTHCDPEDPRFVHMQIHFSYARVRP